MTHSLISVRIRVMNMITTRIVRQVPRYLLYILLLLLLGAAVSSRVRGALVVLRAEGRPEARAARRLRRTGQTYTPGYR